MQTLPAQLLEQIFQHTESNAVSEKSCASLAITCKAFRDAFADSGRQESWKKAALRKLLRWSAKVERTLYKPGKVHPPVRLNIRATLDKRKTQRLTEWLESGLLSVEDFWEAQDPRMAVEEKHGEPIKFLYLVLVAELPTEQFLDENEEGFTRFDGALCTACPDRLQWGANLA